MAKSPAPYQVNLSGHQTGGGPSSWFNDPAQIPAIGPLGGAAGFWDTEADKQQDALQQRFEDMRKGYRDYMPQDANQRMMGLENQLSLFGPINEMLSRMYGPQFTYDTSKLLRNPVQAAQNKTITNQATPPATGVSSAIGDWLNGGGLGTPRRM